jgi:plasmid replication initiation protein
MNEIQIEEHKNNIVAKSNELIQAKGSLSGTAQKMLASLISMLRIDDTEFQEYALRIDDYLKLIGSSSKNKKFLEEQAMELMRNPFRVDGKVFNWCSMVDLERINGYIIFDIHIKLKPYLLELKERGNFTQYKIVNILSLKGEYSPRLYEYFIMEFNQQIKYKKECVITLKIDNLRSFLQIPKSYRYNNIKIQIMEKAKRDFKDHTDIQFTYIEKKIG